MAGNHAWWLSRSMLADEVCCCCMHNHQAPIHCCLCSKARSRLSYRLKVSAT